MSIVYCERNSGSAVTCVASGLSVRIRQPLENLAYLKQGKFEYGYPGWDGRAALDIYWVGALAGNEAVHPRVRVERQAMATRRREPASDQLPSPFPEGWYFIASRQALIKAKLIRKTWMGEDIVAWCDESGRVCVAEAFCPHVGADLGPAAGGRICGGRLVCPFHGYEYDATGQCVATPFADPPKTAKLRVFQTQEVLGLVFAWWGIEGRAPQWSLPADSQEEAGWSDFEIKTIRFPGHPQETTENSVDLGHLRYVHGYDNVNRIGRMSVNGSLSGEPLRLQAHPDDRQDCHDDLRPFRRHPYLWAGRRDESGRHADAGPGRPDDHRPAARGSRHVEASPPNRECVAGH